MQLGDIVEVKKNNEFMGIPKIIELDEYYKNLIENKIIKVVGFVKKEDFERLMKK